MHRVRVDFAVGNRCNPFVDVLTLVVGFIHLMVRIISASRYFAIVLNSFNPLVGQDMRYLLSLKGFG